MFSTSRPRITSNMLTNSYQSEGDWRLAVPRTAYVIPGRVSLGRAWRRRVRFRFRFRCFRFRFRCFRFRPGGSPPAAPTHPAATQPRPTPRRPTRDPPRRGGVGGGEKNQKRNTNGGAREHPRGLRAPPRSCYVFDLFFVLFDSKFLEVAIESSKTLKKLEFQPIEKVSLKPYKKSETGSIERALKSQYRRWG